MRLLHDDLADILIQNVQDSNYTFKGELNRSLAKLIENDIDISPGEDRIPDVWKCGWYNQFDSAVISSRYGYHRGQAVWLNAEDLTDFVYAKWREIESVVEGNPSLSYAYKLIKDDKAKVFDFFRDVVLGNVSGSLNKEPLYCIGEISRQIQLRVSLVDHNVALPTDDRYWKDFFEYDVRERNCAEVSAYLSSQLSAELETHLKDYHMLGADDKQVKSLLADIDVDCVKADLSTELSSVDRQRFLSHRDQYRMSGFDFVKEFRYERGEDGFVKWFKLWDSGYLEQGGIVSGGDGLGDAVDSGFLSVRLLAPYDYIKQRIEKFYAVTDLGNDVKLDDKDCLAPDCRYNVHVTRLKPGGETPYSRMLTDSCYETNAVACVKNGSFQIQVTAESDKYSFYTSGFVKAK